MLREGSVPKSSYPCRWPLLIIVAVDFLNFLCVTEVLARSLLAMPAAAERWMSQLLFGSVCLMRRQNIELRTYSRGRDPLSLM